MGAVGDVGDDAPPTGGTSASGATDGLVPLVPLSHAPGDGEAYRDASYTETAAARVERARDVMKLSHAVTDFLTWCAVHGYAEGTLRARRYYLASFVAFCDERELFDVATISPSALESYQRHLYHQKKENGLPLSFRTQSQRLIPGEGPLRLAGAHRRTLLRPIDRTGTAQGRAPGPRSSSVSRKWK